MPPKNLTGVPAIPSIWGDLNLGDDNMRQLSEAEQLQRKKKLMAASQTGGLQTVSQWLFPRTAGP